MKKLILYASLLCIGVVSCTKEYAVPEDELPSFLGESIYSELKTPKHLQGTFNTYLRLIDDLGYAEVLGKTGSKTIFPANDEAFNAFFKNNVYGVSSYEELSYLQKAQLLYSSMLDNAILVGNLSNEQSSTGDLLQGKLVKHPTNMTLVQSVEPLYSQHYPANNKYYEGLAEGGISVVTDNTISPMVHFTGEYMLNNAMTVSGEASDFEVVTGSPYEDGSTYIFNHRVVEPNVTCQNGYIHQLDGVLVPPGNMAKALRDDKEFSYFSRIVDYFSAPFYNSTVTGDYNSWAIENNEPTIDKIYAIRYFSKNSQRNVLDAYVNDEGRKGEKLNDAQLLSLDPGWNYYNPTTDGNVSNDAEIAAMLAPSDEAIWNYFKENGGGGSYIIKNLGCKENTRENFPENLDAIFNNDQTVFANIVNNLMKPYFSNTVPSKFSTVMNDAFEFMDIHLDDIQKKDNGQYDVTIANNGVIYKMNKLFAPQLYNSVLGPASIYTNLRSMGQMLNDHTTKTNATLGVDMYYYLLSMKSRYAVFTPEDNDNFVFIDPTSIYDQDGLKGLRFRFNAEAPEKFKVYVQKGLYNVETNKFEPLADYPEESIAPEDENGTILATLRYKTQIQDMLNYHTVVLAGDQNTLTGNRFYKTKHGGAIYVPQGKGNNGESVCGGIQADGGVKAATIMKQYSTQTNPQADPDAEIENGTCYVLDRPIQPTVRSAYSVLSKQFTKFYEFMDGFEGNSEVLSFAGISDEVKSGGKSEQTSYYMFDVNHDDPDPALRDYRLRMLGSYNYTLYAPTDNAMEEAYKMGLPKWDDVIAIYQEWGDKEGEEGYAEASKRAKKLIDTMRDFVFYHVQNSSYFADQSVETNKNAQTFMTDKAGVTQTLSISGGNGNLVIKDAAAKTLGDVTVNWNSADANLITRDIVIVEEAGIKNIQSSAFVTIQGVSRPLCFNASGKFME